MRFFTTLLILLGSLSAGAQFSLQQHLIIDSLAKNPLKRLDGFYGSTIRYLRNTPAYTEGFVVNQNSESYHNCIFYSYQLNDKDNKKIKRKYFFLH